MRFEISTPTGIMPEANLGKEIGLLNKVILDICLNIYRTKVQSEFEIAWKNPRAVNCSKTRF